MNKFWDIFIAVSKVLGSEDLKGFGKALFYGTAFKNLSREAKRVLEALAIKIGPSTNPAEIYLALAAQSWGYSSLKEIAKGVEDKWLFRQLSTGNRDRIEKAESKIKWPEVAVVTEPKIEEINKGRKRDGGALGVVALVATLILFALSGCVENTRIARLPGTSADFVLYGTLENAFKRVVAHEAEAITVSERVTIYGTGEPPSEMLKCHEDVHKQQARGIGDALVAIGAIDDTVVDRMVAWLTVYGQEYLKKGYDRNRFEIQARERCQ